MELLTEVLRLVGALVNLANGVIKFLSTASEHEHENEEGR